MAEPESIIILRVELEGIEPLIWRRVAVPSGMRLTGLHHVIQAAMGWQDSHLWYFELAERRFALRLRSEPEWNERYEDAAGVSLGTLLDAGLRRMAYAYDMGDFWEHSIIVEKVSASLPDLHYPQFLGGERRCPPEDCGGPQGYNEFLRNISSKKRKTCEEALRWYGRAYDPDDVDETKIVRALGKIARARAKV